MRRLLPPLRIIGWTVLASLMAAVWAFFALLAGGGQP